MAEGRGSKGSSRQPRKKPTDELPPGVRLLRTLEGHQEAVWRVSFSPEGRWLASSSDDKTVRLWETSSGKELRQFAGHQGLIGSLSFSPDGRRLASGSHDHTVRLWDAVTGKDLNQIVTGHGAGIGSLAFSPDGQWLASGSVGSAARLWDAASGKELRQFTGHQDHVGGVSFSPDGRWLASGDGVGTVRLWDTASGKELRRFAGHAGAVDSVSFSPDGRWLASSGEDKTVRLWAASNGKLLRTLEGHTASALSVAFSCHGQLLASKSMDGTIRVWRCDTWDLVTVIPEPCREHWFIPALAFHPTLPWLATAGSTPGTPAKEIRCNQIHLWELDLAVLLGRKPRETSGHYRNAKVVMVGNTSVGKSGLGLVLAGRKFRATDSTHGRHIRRIEIKEVQRVVVSPYRKSSATKAPTLKVTETHETFLWDLAGQPAYRLVHQLHLNEVAVALVVFDSRSETEPFAGVPYWARALDQARGQFPLTKLLVAARIDRGGVAVSQERVDEMVSHFNFDHFIATSAKRGDGIIKLRELICDAVPWADLPAVTRTAEFVEAKEFLAEQKRKGVVVGTVDELLQQLRRRRASKGAVTADVFATCLRQLEATGLIQRLSFGDYILLQPELLDSYAGWLTLAAREEPDGLGHLAEEDARAGRFPMDKNRPLARKREEKMLLLAAVEETLARGLAMREYDERHRRSVLVFPTELKKELKGYPGSYSLAVAFRFSGPVRGIYASLVVKLIYSIPFAKKRLYRDSAVFAGPGGAVCGLAVDFPDLNDDSIGRLTVFFEECVSKDTRLLFLRYVDKQIGDMAFKGSIERQRVYHCGDCGISIDQRSVDIAGRNNRTTVVCSSCGRHFPLDDLAEEAARPGADIDAMEAEATAGQEQASRQTVLEERRKRHEFHVFLCHNSRDKTAVRALARTLEDQGILPWLDDERVFAGDAFQKKLEAAIAAARAVAVCIGPYGVGRWQEVEYFAAYQQFIERDRAAGKEEVLGGGVRLIPVLLPGSREENVPTFARQLDHVDLRVTDGAKYREQLRKLVKAILSATADR